MAGSPTAASMRFFVYIFISCHVAPFALCLCEHGTYDHEGRKCCHCGPGQHIKEHCTVSGTSGRCVPCESGTYKSEPSISACKPCTSCGQANANLEEDTLCKPVADRKCRCKDGYYCLSTTGACTVCLLCKECDHGVKVACTQHNDAECELKSHGGIIAGAVIGVLAILAVIAGIIWWKKYRGNNHQENEEEQPMRQIPDDIDPHRHGLELANIIGWRDMHRVAMSSGISKTEIENCEQQYNDLTDRTIKLLDIYTEKVGRGWGERLRGSLIRNERRNKAQQVERILLQDDSNNLAV